MSGHSPSGGHNPSSGHNPSGGPHSSQLEITSRANEGRHRWRSLTAWVAPGAIVLLTLAFYRRILLTNLILSGVDALTYFYPYRAYVAASIREGRVPLWNPYLFLGAPCLANPQAGVFYPLNLTLSWLTAPKMVAWSIAIHVALAGVLAYLYARRAARLSPWGALLGASAFAFGGFLSGQVEHVNQLNASAWFPLLLLLWEGRSRARWPVVLGLGAVIGLGLLAGHTQSSYISASSLALYAFLGVLLEGWRERRPQGLGKALVRPLLRALLDLALAGLIGAALASVQLLPTLELSRLSIRAGGMSYREAVAFSLKPLPRLLRYTFLPPGGANLADVFGGDFYTEYLAYMGVVPLLLAMVAVGSWLGRRATARLPGQLLGLAAAGVFLALGGYNPVYWALYKLVPGFDLFRVPARWLFPYAFGAAMLAGVGSDRIGGWLEGRISHRTGKKASELERRVSSVRWSPHYWSWVARSVAMVLLLLALVELFSAARSLPLNHPTAPEAFSSLRTAPAHILAAQEMEQAPGRFLSISDIAFDPGDLIDIELMFGSALPEKELYDYVVSLKRQEILAPNLPLAWGIYAADGYDGGVLPLARYVALQHLFLPDEEILFDGRLREGLERVPPSRLLSLLGVHYVITDKVHDAWIDDVFYDLAFEAVLDGREPSAPDRHPESVAGPVHPPFKATGLGLVSYLEGAGDVADGTPVAEVRLTTAGGDAVRLTLHAGQDTAEGSYDPSVAHAQARIGRGPSQTGGYDYVAQLGWEEPRQIVGVEVATLPFGGQLHVRGLTLIDARDGSNVPVILSTDGRYRQVHSGDVKVYEVLDALPRAYVVHQAQVIPEDDRALEALADPAHDPSQIVVLASGQPLQGSAPFRPEVQVLSYAPEEATIQATLGAPGYLVLSDSWYPGWAATVDGQRARIERANVAFRAVYLPQGTHTVRWTYRPQSFRVGLGLSLITLLGWVVATLRCARSSSVP
jgi:hypothetical protein